MSVTQKTLNSFEKAVCDLYVVSMNKEGRTEFWRSFQMLQEVLQTMGHEMQFRSPYTVSNRNKRRTRKNLQYTN